MYINIDITLLNERLKMLARNTGHDVFWEPFNPTKQNIRDIFKKYYVVEFIEEFYDSEPHYKDEDEHELHRMSWDYKDLLASNKTTNFCPADLKYCKQPHSLKELKAAHRYVSQQIAKFQPKRLAFNNWFDVYGEGMWGMSQVEADKMASDTMEELRQVSVHRHNRWWMIKEGNGRLIIFYYGRDWRDADYIWYLEDRALYVSQDTSDTTKRYCLHIKHQVSHEEQEEKDLYYSRLEDAINSGKWLPDNWAATLSDYFTHEPNVGADYNNWTAQERLQWNQYIENSEIYVYDTQEDQVVWQPESSLYEQWGWCKIDAFPYSEFWHPLNYIERAQEDNLNENPKYANPNSNQR